MITIWFEPHSITTDNEASLASGWNDVDLSEEGLKRLVEQWPARYEERNVDAIFSSDMQRAYKCGALIANQQKLPMYIDERLRECNYGQLTQHPKAEIDALKADRVEKPFPDGESYQDCAKRMNDFLDYLKQNFDGKTVLVIGHRATQYGLEHYINGKDLLSCVTEAWEYQPGWRYSY